MTAFALGSLLQFMLIHICIQSNTVEFFGKLIRKIQHVFLTEQLCVYDEGATKRIGIHSHKFNKYSNV